MNPTLKPGPLAAKLYIIYGSICSSTITNLQLVFSPPFFYYIKLSIYIKQISILRVFLPYSLVYAVIASTDSS